MTLVSSANNTGSDIKFILRGRSFMYITNIRDPRIDPWGIPCFNVPHTHKKMFLAVLGDFTPTVCLLLVKQDLNQSSDTPHIP